MDISISIPIRIKFAFIDQLQRPQVSKWDDIFHEVAFMLVIDMIKESQITKVAICVEIYQSMYLICFVLHIMIR